MGRTNSDPSTNFETIGGDDLKPCRAPRGKAFNGGEGNCRGTLVVVNNLALFFVGGIPLCLFQRLGVSSFSPSICTEDCFAHRLEPVQPQLTFSPLLLGGID